MPLIDSIVVDKFTQIVTWDIKESKEDLITNLNLSSYRIEKLKKLTDKRQKEFLGIRACLKSLNLDVDVLYEPSGKPYLSTDHHVSISHSHGLVSVGVSKFKIGIDIEKNRPHKINTIKGKFIRDDEDFFWGFENESDYLHVIWGIKEGLYKLHLGNLISFTQNYKVDAFDIQSKKSIKSWVTNEYLSEKYFSYHKRINDYFLIYVLDYEA
ncbi:MAG: 4-phosphopantetheinyl transferase [Flavobacteriales bacterium]|nr:4-phosphopantetheinyl transferase [Flavobacteriales bacterium]